MRSSSPWVRFGVVQLRAELRSAAGCAPSALSSRKASVSALRAPGRGPAWLDLACVVDVAGWHGHGTPPRVGRRDCSSSPTFLDGGGRASGAGGALGLVGRPRTRRRRYRCWPVTASASRLIAWLTGCLGWDDVIGSPALVALATSGEVGIAWAIFMSRVVSTFSGRQPDLVVGAVEHQVAARLGEVEQVEGLAGDLDVLQGRHVEGGDEQQLVGLVEGLEDVLVERGGGVDDDVVEVRLEDREDPRDQRRRGSSPWRRAAPARPGSRSPRRCGVSSGSSTVKSRLALERDGVGDGARGEQLEGDRDVAEAEVEVDQADPRRPRRAVRRDREVRGDRGLADPALGGEDREQRARRARRHRGCSGR